MDRKAGFDLYIPFKNKKQNFDIECCDKHTISLNGNEKNLEMQPKFRTWIVACHRSISKKKNHNIDDLCVSALHSSNKKRMFRDNGTGQPEVECTTY